MSRRHDKIDKENFAIQLKQYRKEHNLSQEELARMIDTSVFSVNRWETAKHHPNRPILKLMKMLKILA